MPRKQPRWSAPLTRPIAVKDGPTLRTLHDARAFVLSLPKGIQLEQSWQRVTELLSAAAEGDRDIEAATHGAANQRLKALKALFAWGCEDRPDVAPRNPTWGVRKIKYASAGHHSWTAEEIAQYRERHPLGSKARLALDLLVYTGGRREDAGGRREDAVRLGPQHVRNNRVRFRQAKNEHRTPIDIDIPLHPELEASIVATPSGHLTFLVTEFGRPFTSAGFGNWFRDQCDKANLHHCSAHGLRKATAAALAEAGASTHEIAAVTGHMSLEEIERYTRAVRKRKLADAAMAKLK
jgi:integrase/recombinase XerD